MWPVFTMDKERISLLYRGMLVLTASWLHQFINWYLSTVGLSFGDVNAICHKYAVGISNESSTTFLRGLSTAAISFKGNFYIQLVLDALFFLTYLVTPRTTPFRW